MPIYEYKCNKCQNTFEKNLPMAEAGKSVKCPDCGQKAERVFSFVAKTEQAKAPAPACATGSCPFMRN